MFPRGKGTSTARNSLAIFLDAVKTESPRPRVKFSLTVTSRDPTKSVCKGEQLGSQWLLMMLVAVHSSVIADVHIRDGLQGLMKRQCCRH